MKRERCILLLSYEVNGITGFTHKTANGSTNYYYRKNLLGDVTAIYDAAGACKAEYAYDAWGNCTVISDMGGIGALNPIRYRGYYWDEEIALYYLNARYYDPEVGRFISQDSIDYFLPRKLNGVNLYSYCHNNPVMNKDLSGNSIITFSAFSTMLEYLGSVSFGVMANMAKQAGRSDILKTLNVSAKKTGKAITVISMVATTLDVAINLYGDLKNGKDVVRSISDAAVDLALGLGTILLANAIAGAVAGSACPIIGNLVGFGVGMAIGLITYSLTPYLEKVEAVVKEIVYDSVTTIINEVNRWGNEINNFFNGVINFIFG